MHPVRHINEIFSHFNFIDIWYVVDNIFLGARNFWADSFYYLKCCIYNLKNHNVQFVCYTHCETQVLDINHDDVIKLKHFPRYWPFVQGIHQSPVNSHQHAQRPVTRSFDVFFDLPHGWVNSRQAGDLRCHFAHYDVIVMILSHYAQFGIGHICTNYSLRHPSYIMDCWQPKPKVRHVMIYHMALNHGSVKKIQVMM